jgi:transposase
MITVTAKEEQRALGLNRVLAGEWTVGEAAAALGLSERQVRRLKVAYMQEGIRALVHGNRGHHSERALPAATRARILALARGAYAGCNDQQFTELLGEREGLVVSRETVRRLLRGAGLRSPRRRRAPKHRARRERMPSAGMLLQIDGSRHDWLEGRGPYLTLVGGIDDATGIIPYALFREQEDAQGYFLLLEQVVRRFGCPVAVYRDRHGIFERPPRERRSFAEPWDRPESTQFGRLLAELGIGSIAARSPQAKGRIERVWGTLQDRLVTELRLAGARTLDEANTILWAYLPRFNQQFAVPALAAPAYRPAPAASDLAQLFCFKFERTVAADNTVQLGDDRIQLLADGSRASYAKARVVLHQAMDGRLAVYYQGRLVGSREAPLETPKLRLERKTKLALAPAPPPPVTPPPLSLEEALKRARAALGPSPYNRRWRGRPAAHSPTAQSDADKITEQLSGQNH